MKALKNIRNGAKLAFVASLVANAGIALAAPDQPFRLAQASKPAAPAVPQAAPTATPAPAPGDAGADQTTASFGDWQLRCRLTPAAAGQPAQRGCEVVQTVILQGQTAPFAQLGFGKLNPNDPLYFTAVVPPNVTFPSSVKIAVSAEDKQPVDVAWTRCLPGGCFASLALKDEVLKKWRAQNDMGQLTFKNGAGQDLNVPISFKGLSRALDALSKESQ